MNYEAAKKSKEYSLNSSYYLSSRYYLELYFMIPSIFYLGIITYIIHISNNFEESKLKIDQKSILSKLYISLVMTMYFFYQIFLVSFVTSDLESLDLFCLIFIQVLQIIISLLTPYVSKKISKFNIPIPYEYFFKSFWFLIFIKISIEIYYEVFYNMFFRYITLSTFGFVFSFFLSYSLFMFPRNHMAIANNEILFELHNIRLFTPKDCRNRTEDKQGGLTNYPKRVDSNSPYRTAINGKKSVKSTIVRNFTDDISLDDISNNQPELLPSYPKIEILIKENYKYFQTFNDFFKSPKHSHKLKDKGDFFTNFYFTITINIKDKNIIKTVKRNIKDFLDLEQDLKEEFTIEKYSKKIIERMPQLKLPKNYQSPDFFKNYKLNFELFLKNIVNEPCLISEEVLDFLDIKDENMSFSYDLARKKNLIKNRANDDSAKINIFNQNLKNVKIDEEDTFIRKSIINLKSEELKFSSKASNKNLSKFEPLHTPVKMEPRKEVTFSQNITPKNIGIKFNVLRMKKAGYNNSQNIIQDLVLEIRVSQSSMFRIVTKKFIEILEFVKELSVINKTNENIKNLLKIFSDIHSSNTFSPYSSNKLNFLLENVIQNSYDNLKLYNNSDIVEFFNELVDESWTMSRCESLIINNFDSKNPNENNIHKKKKEDILNQASHGLIKSVKVNILKSFMLNLNFKPNWFYLTSIDISLNDGSTEEVKKKYKYKELNQFIYEMAIRLNIIHKLVKGNIVYRIQNDKLNTRKLELQSNVDTIFNSINFRDNIEWTELLSRDYKYQLIKSENKQDNTAKPSIIFKQRTESEDSIIEFNLRDSILN